MGMMRRYAALTSRILIGEKDSGKHVASCIKRSVELHYFALFGAYSVWNLQYLFDYVVYSHILWQKIYLTCTVDTVGIQLNNQMSSSLRHLVYKTLSEHVKLV